ncbi:MAG: ISKra4 family transposase [Chloroflexi bacterium]|nr:ISKra4 family transposase [Chloroflexota bacterium]
MTLNSTQMIPQLREEFEQLLAFVTGPQARTATMDQMERSLFRRILHLGYQFLRLFIMRRVETETHAPLVRRDKSVLPYHSQKGRDYFSIFGKLKFERAYFYAGGGSGSCPLDEALSLPENCYSDLLMESVELLGVEGAYGKGLQVVARLLGLNLPILALESSVMEHSQNIKAYYHQKAAFPSAEEGSILVAQADGKGVPLVRRELDVKVRRGKGDKKTQKKEAIATAVYTIEPYLRTPLEVLNALFKEDEPPAERPAPHHKQIFASLKGKESAIKRLASWVQRREGAHICQRVALTDGAEPLQKQMLACLPGFPLVLDIIHAVEYLWKAGTAIYGETDSSRTEWVKAQTLRLLSSQTEQVIQLLEDKAASLSPNSQAAKALRGSAHYFRRNLPYMDYAEYLRRGWPIGTGVIEGTCRHLVKDRMELSGMRWTIAGAEALLALRAANENGDWEDFHTLRRTQRHHVLYGAPLKINPLEQAERLETNQF